MHARPHAQRAERFGQLEHARFHRLAVDEIRAVFHVDTVRRCVLRNHQKFFHAGLHEGLGFAHHFANRATHQIAAHRRNNAEAATVIAAFADFQIRVVLRREFHAVIGHQIDELVVRFRQMQMHRVHHFVRCVRAGNGEHFRVNVPNEIAVLLRAETARNDHFTVFGDSLANRVKRLRHGVVDKAAGVDHHQIRVAVIADGCVALRLQARQHLFAIDERLRATE